MKEAKARIKINRLLEEAGWRFFDSHAGPANITLENAVKITATCLDQFGEDFEKTTNGYVDFLLLDEDKFPAVVLEAKSEQKDPLDGKEQARKYANSLKVRFVILSNGNLHYFWDIETGNPDVITSFPTLESIAHKKRFKPNPATLTNELIDQDYILLTQKPDYSSDPRWLDETQRDAFLKENGLKLLRPYQVRAVRSIQDAVAKAKSRFLFEMATGTGKTLIAAAVMKLFLRTSNAKRVLFLVDRIELETQAHKNLNRYLKNDFSTVIYKQSRDDWNKAEILVTTIQSLLSDNKYKRLFSPTDFALQVTSRITDSQRFALNFANNNLNGHTKWLDSYPSSKTRVCVTVGMMTTGYDCEDILNLCLMRPIFSPQDFVQIKGRGTRKFSFEYKQRTPSGDTELTAKSKEHFKLFDFFANCEYFEHKYKYDEVIELPAATGQGEGAEGPPPVRIPEYESLRPDPLKTIVESPVGLDGMRIDREFFGKFEQVVKKDQFVTQKVSDGDFDAAETYILENIFERPEDFFNLEKLRKAVQLDRRLTLREILEKIFGFIPGFKTKEDLLEEECQKFISIYKPPSDCVLPIKNFLKAYVTDPKVREIVESKRYADFATSPTADDFRALNTDLRKFIPEYVKDYVPLNRFI